MKELGHCPRCNSAEIIVQNSPGKRLEVCQNCGYVDTYLLGSAKNNPSKAMFWSLFFGLLPLIGFILYLTLG